MLEIKNLKIKIKSQGNVEDQDGVVLGKINLSMEPGKAYVLDGRNGSGKSSLLSAIMGHPNYEIVEGEIVIKNNSIENLIKNNNVESSAAAGIYMTMQNVPEIEGVTLIQLLHKSINKKSPVSILDLNKKLIKYCEDFDIDKSFISRDLNYKMSGGEKKQAELLHILALAPAYILVDEIDSGVDRESIEKIYKVLKYIQKENNSALLIVSHHTNVNDYLNVEKIYTLDNKTIV